MNILNNGLIFEILGNEVLIIGHTKEKIEEIVIPSQIDGYPVTNIGYYAFCNCKKLTNWPPQACDFSHELGGFFYFNFIIFYVEKIY